MGGSEVLRAAERYLGANLDLVDIYCEEGEQIAGATIFNRGRIKLFDHEHMVLYPGINKWGFPKWLKQNI